jgi:hypothetical protein
MTLGCIVDFSPTSEVVFPNFAFVMFLSLWLFQLLNMAGSQYGSKSLKTDLSSGCNIGMKMEFGTIEDLVMFCLQFRI